MICAIVTDIEGTTTDIDFVHKVLFPFSEQHLDEFVQTHQHEPEVKAALLQVFTTGIDEKLIPGTCAFSITTVLELLHQFIREDRKHPGLKVLQGKIWKSGYESKAFTSHIYPDVPETLQTWNKAGVRLAVYSSGSVEAQLLLFGHTAHGDLTPLFSAFYDTKVGAKRERKSYDAIGKDLGLDPHSICFLSDIKEELDAAQQAGFKTVQLVRNDRVVVGTHHQAADFKEVAQFIKSL